ncbi:TonB family protein [bacterium]|nr:TonB family protein [bacterium]
MRALGRYLVLAVLAAVVNLLLLGATTILSQEREPPQDISDPVGVSLVSLKAPEPPEQEEIKDPEPPPPQEKPDFAPDLVQPGLGDMGGPAIGVSINVGGVEREAAKTSFIFDSVDLDRAPEVVSRVNPEYPYQARERGIEGYVAVKVLVSEDGSVRQVNVLKAKPKGVFDTAVRRAVPNWRFKPGEVGGEPVTAWVTTTLHFRLN